MAAKEFWPILSLSRLAVCGFFLSVLGTQETASAAVNLVRITPAQYKQTVKDVFGSGIIIDPNFVETGYRNDGLIALGTRKLTVTSVGFEQYEELAQQVSSQVIAPEHRSTLIQCGPKGSTDVDENCARQFISRAGLLLFRRPLSQEELQRYGDLEAESTKRTANFYEGIGSALSAMLVSPSFLFRVEKTEPDRANPGKLRLNPYSSASRLSFFLWNAAPDAELLSAAKSGELETRRGLDTQVDRLLNSPRAEAGVRAFFTDMLQFDQFDTLAKDPTFFPKFTKPLQDDAREETLRTIVEHLLVRNGDYRDLFVTRDTFLTANLAALYGVPLSYDPVIGVKSPWVPYSYPENEPRAGILAQVSFLALHSQAGRTSPTLRGKALREVFLCQRIPPPPGNVNFKLVQDTSNPNFKTARQRLAAHATEPMCSGCHRLMDPVGLAFEKFDSAGAYRTTENGANIDITGVFDGKKYSDLLDLATLLRSDPATTSCLVNRVFSYGTERSPTVVEHKWLAALSDELTKQGVRWQELARRIAESPNFYTVEDSVDVSSLAGRSAARVKSVKEGIDGPR
jgi:hypothetical protein